MFNRKKELHADSGQHEGLLLYSIQNYGKEEIN